MVSFLQIYEDIKIRYENKNLPEFLRTVLDGDLSSSGYNLFDDEIYIFRTSNNERLHVGPLVWTKKRC